jgi:hypothetical protein
LKVNTASALTYASLDEQYQAGLVGDLLKGIAGLPMAILHEFMARLLEPVPNP